MSAVASRAVVARPESESSDCDEEQRWYAVFTQPRREMHAELRLRDLGYKTFLPHRLKTTRHARRTETKRSPFFPRYLFVALAPARQQWRRINSTAGVVALVTAGQLPLPVPRGVVEELMDFSDATGCLRPRHPLVSGERVRLLAGPLADRIGILDRVDEVGAVRVLLEIMGGAVPVRVSGRSLWPIAAT